MIGLGEHEVERFSEVDNRVALSRRKHRMLTQGDWISGVMREARRLAQSLRGCSTSQLRQHTATLRKLSRSKLEAERYHGLSLSGAVVIESIERTLGLRLFDVQLRAGLVVSGDAVAEMQTGEGKTLTAVLPAYVKALHGRGVHVATPNEYLASRDEQRLRPVFETLDMTTGLVSEKSKSHERRIAYQADVTYGPGHLFGFDYLRDQLTLAANPHSATQTAIRADSETVSETPWTTRLSGSLGARTLERLSGRRVEAELIQRGLYASIVDEIDHVLIDDAVSPLLLSSGRHGEARDAEVHLAARELAAKLRADEDYRMERGRPPHLLDRGFDRVYARHDMAVHVSLVRPWHEYVVLALRASIQLQRDVDYIVRDDDVRIIDPTTGRIFDDRSWSDGLHQAVQASEGLTVKGEQEALARITRQRFYRYYRSLAGMTGTATGCEKEFASVYGLPVIVIPQRIPSRRRRLPDHLSIDFQEKWRAIAEETERITVDGRAVLIGTLNIAESRGVADQLAARGLDFELLNGVQDADEASVIARAGRPGAITVATNLAGRGTDIALDSEVARRGGLHVIVTQMHSLARVDRQLIGRCARCGDPGSTRIYLSADDHLIRDHASWLGRAIARAIGRNDSHPPALERQLRRVQRRLERRESAQRWSLLQHDRENEQLLTRKCPTPRGCWQL